MHFFKNDINLVEYMTKLTLPHNLYLCHIKVPQSKKEISLHN